jgi:DMSO/TMAO reductase YedYZ molybdopterin-dependent catalytic subunit
MTVAAAAQAEEELRVVTREPFNAETLLAALTGILTPVGRHYVRNHFAIPTHPGTLTFGGAVDRPLTLSVAELMARPPASRFVTLECAGNGRAFLDPLPPGEPWRLGAVGTAEWTGVPLAELLAEVGVSPEAVEIRFRGADRGTPGGLRREIVFERSLPPDVAGDALIAYAMDGRPLTPNHGAPLRLVVPGWYGMASVKWLTEISVATEPFRGFFQVERYVVEGGPLGPIAPRAVIVAPADGALVARGPNTIRGFAWSGRGLARVEVSLDGGTTWRRARLGSRLAAEAWQTWQLRWSARKPGPAVIVARAVEVGGRAQPLEAVHDPLGYGNNAAQPVRVEVLRHRR